uniref:Uncharacterized protein n=1 Tax=Knipowitschia caucasica TaxID=637954 RepID=A0AAV2LFE5_KNICA
MFPSGLRTESQALSPLQPELSQGQAGGPPREQCQDRANSPTAPKAAALHADLPRNVSTDRPASHICARPMTVQTGIRATSGLWLLGPGRGRDRNERWGSGGGEMCVWGGGSLSCDESRHLRSSKGPPS